MRTASAAANVPVGERQRLGHTADGRRRVRGSLLEHHGRGFERDDRAVARLVRPGPGADVQHRRRVAERGVELAFEARIGDAVGR